MPAKPTKFGSFVLMVVIANKGKGEKIAQSFSDKGVAFSLFTLGKGTANKKILTYLGLGETEKDIVFSTVPYDLSLSFMEFLGNEMGFKKPGIGVAFSIAINDFSDAAVDIFLTEVEQKKGVMEMDITPQHDLIIAITNQGYSEDIMDVVRSAGATGGTVLHGRGVGLKEAEKFFGITIQPEKEMVLILVKTPIRQKVMTAIAEQKGYHTDAKTIAFSLPVNGVVGLPEDFEAAKQG